MNRLKPRVGVCVCCCGGGRFGPALKRRNHTQPRQHEVRRAYNDGFSTRGMNELLKVGLVVSSKKHYEHLKHCLIALWNDEFLCHARHTYVRERVCVCWVIAT